MKWINLTGVIAVIVVNALANILPINGMNTGEISGMFPNLFVPAGITFSIWSVIYLGLLGYCLYPFVQKEPNNVQGVLFFTTCLLNISWILAWHHLLIELSVLIMISLLITLTKMYLNTKTDNRIDYWLIYLPINIYFSWISVATIANVTALFVHWELNLPYPAIITIVMIAITQLLVLQINSRKVNWPYSLVIVWALSGVIIKRINTEPIYVSIMIASIAAIMVTLFITILKGRNQSIMSKLV